MRQVLAWAVNHDAVALRLAEALGWWWWLRGRLAASTGCCARWPPAPRRGATGGAPSSPGWGGPRFLGRPSRALGHFTAVLEAVGAGGRPGCWPMPWPAGWWYC